MLNNPDTFRYFELDGLTSDDYALAASVAQDAVFAGIEFTFCIEYPVFRFTVHVRHVRTFNQIVLEQRARPARAPAA